MNKTIVEGKIVGPITKTREREKETYSFVLESIRANGRTDSILIHSNEFSFAGNDSVIVKGRLLSEVREERRTEVFLMAEEIDALKRKNIRRNTVDISGVVVKNCGIYTTSKGTRVSTIVIATDDESYIPCIAFAETADLAEGIDLGEQITLNGKLQGRYANIRGKYVLINEVKMYSFILGGEQIEDGEI